MSAMLDTIVSAIRSRQNERLRAERIAHVRSAHNRHYESILNQMRYGHVRRAREYFDRYLADLRRYRPEVQRPDIEVLRRECEAAQARGITVDGAAGITFSANVSCERVDYGENTMTIAWNGTSTLFEGRATAHPHIHRNSICTGHYGPNVLYQLMTAFQFCAAADWLVNQLRSWSREDAYRPLHWHKCQQCGRHPIETDGAPRGASARWGIPRKCAKCDAQGCDSCMSHNQPCDTCRRVCRGCGATRTIPAKCYVCVPEQSARMLAVLHKKLAALPADKCESAHCYLALATASNEIQAARYRRTYWVEAKRMITALAKKEGAK